MKRKLSARGNPSRGQLYEADPTAIYVSVYCPGDKDHPHEKWNIATFYLDVETSKVAGHPYWAESSTGYQTALSHTLLPLGPPVTAWLVGDRYVPQTRGRPMEPGIMDSPGARRTFNLSCKRCPMTKMQRKDEDFQPVLSKLYASGVSELSLSGLGAIL